MVTQFVIFVICQENYNLLNEITIVNEREHLKKNENNFKMLPFYYTPPGIGNQTNLSVCL